MTDSTPRPSAPDHRPVALTVAGSDSGGGAGIQADLKTMEACGVFGTSAITAVTAQHTQGIESTHELPVREVAEQIDAVRGDFAVDAIKTGMLATGPIVGTVTRNLDGIDAPVVVDPVMVAASGDRLLDEEAEAAYDDLTAMARLVTPNADEAEVLTDVAVDDVDAAIEAGRAIVDDGADAALVKGGHVSGSPVEDVLVTDPAAVDVPDDDADASAVAHGPSVTVRAETDDVLVYEHRRVETEATHGSGCTLSSAVAAHLARGTDLPGAVGSGIALLDRAVRYHQDHGEGPGSVHHLVELREQAEREPTAAAVAAVVDRFVTADVSALVPEVGMNVVGATPYAESVLETFAVDGRITRTANGAVPNGGVRAGASDHVARFLLACREHDPALRFAVNCRHTDDTRAALDAIDGPVASYDRADQPDDVREREGGTMPWAADEAFASVDATPVAVTDPGGPGKEPMIKLLATDAATLRDRVLTVDDATSPSP